ncbi:MAG TPA: hypothetical protein GX004_06710 [Firmicutes bacterium]|nr:hypothetical protein [Bacillota bacterium]
MAQNSIVITPEQLIFVMDIGTRSVIGVVCYPQKEKLRVLATEVAYHPQRDMLDGQIHNIEGVIKTAGQVKNKLENRLGVSLRKVSLAAAGRALKTCRHLAERKVESGHKIRKEEIASLELEAVEKSQDILINEGTNANDAYYCIGYTAVAYYLDDYPITNLLGQKGNKIGVEVLSTFLPRVVIDSLLTVVEGLGMTINNLTLEPIAALNVTIPKEYRSLNLALVDIGAGTSDIAITHKGTVVGYAMVPLAGDEITEQIADAFLLDFNTAEKVKLMLTGKKANISFNDILGNHHKLPLEKIIEVIEPAANKIAAEIASVIKELNRGPTRALFCIGGGSQTPLLREKLAEQMGLPLEKVVIRGREIVNQIKYSGRKLKGPESITPFGIAVSSLEKDYFGFSYITVNGKVVRLLDTEPKVGNALLAAGFSSKKLLGQRGPGIKIYIDGKEKILPGTPGENARILLNGKEASLETAVNNNDKIEIVEASAGKAPLVKIRDFFPPERYYVYLNDERISLWPSLYLNGKKANPEKNLKDGDKLDYKGMGTLGDFFKIAELNPENILFKVNQHPSSLQYELQPGDRINIVFKQNHTPPKQPETQETP